MDYPVGSMQNPEESEILGFWRQPNLRPVAEAAAKGTSLKGIRTKQNGFGDVVSAVIS